MQTKSQVLETHWLEFLQWIKDNPLVHQQALDPVEQDFWQWYLDTKMETSRSVGN